MLQRTTAFGFYDDNFVLALERRTDHLGVAAPAHLSRQRVWRLRARQVVARHRRARAPGRVRRQRPARHHARRRGPHLPAPLRRAAPAAGPWCSPPTTAPTRRPSTSATPASRSPPSSTPGRRRPRAGPGSARGAGSRCAPGRWSPARAGRRASPGRTSPSWSTAGSGTAPASAATCSLVSGGWNPAVHLYSQARGRLSYDDSIGAFLPGTDVAGVGVAGSARGRFTLGECLRDGAAVARSALTACGLDVPRARDAGHRRRGGRPVAHAVVRARSRRAGLRPHAVRRPAARRDRRRRPARDRGRACGRSSTSSATRPSGPRTTRARRRGSSPPASSPTPSACDIADLGTTTFRPPYTPVSFAALAGRDRGHLHDPVRVTPLHEWHVAHGAMFEDVGQWKRPWFFPRAGRGPWRPPCCGSAGPPGESVAMMDASTLGKIEVQGADAGRAARPRLHQPDQHPQGRRDPLRRDVRGRRDDRSTTAR